MMEQCGPKGRGLCSLDPFVAVQRAEPEVAGGIQQPYTRMAEGWVGQ